MAFCKFCGKELDADGNCYCKEFINDSKKKEAMKGTVEATAAKSKKSKKGIFKIIVIAVVVLALFAVIWWIASSVSTYKTPVEKLAKGISKADAEMIIDNIYTENSTAELRVKAKNSGLSWSDYLKKNNKAIRSAMDGLGMKKVRAKVVAKEKLGGSNFEEVETYYKNAYDADVKKAYRVEVEFTVKRNGKKETVSGWLCVVKLKKDGWRFCPEIGTDSFDFIDNAINLFEN